MTGRQRRFKAMLVRRPPKDHFVCTSYDGTKRRQHRTLMDGLLEVQKVRRKWGKSSRVVIWPGHTETFTPR